MTTAADLRAHLARLEDLRRLEVAKATQRPVWRPEPHQIRPAGDPYLWLLLAGRGAGKTDACASYFDEFMRRQDRARGGIIAPTLGDAVEACVTGASGLQAHNPRVRLVSRAGGTFVLWPNGSTAKLFGTHTKDDVDRLRAGGNRHIYWGEEIAAWRYLKEAVENMELGLRLGRFPHWIASTTPKTRPYLRTLMKATDTSLTTATIYDNPHLPQVQKDRLIGRHKGTRLEAQELLGQYLEDVEGALWTYETILACRVETSPDLVEVVVAVDPSGGDEEGNDEQGIIVAGKGKDGHGYVIADYSCKTTPAGWGKAAVKAYDDHGGDRIVGEVNFGGDMVVATVQAAATKLGLRCRIKKVSHSRGKAIRAEPISALYEQGRIHHVGVFEKLEEQYRFWTADSGWSPDRLDAAVTALSELGLTKMPRKPMTSHLPPEDVRLPGPDERYATTARV